MIQHDLYFDNTFINDFLKIYKNEKKPDKMRIYHHKKTIIQYLNQNS